MIANHMSSANETAFDSIKQIMGTGFFVNYEDGVPLAVALGLLSVQPLDRAL